MKLTRWSISGLLLVGSRGPGGEAGALAAHVVEVLVVEPRVERCAHARPLAVGDREPVGVAVAALVDEGVAEPALPDEAEPERSATRRRVEAVALPLVTAVPEVVEDVTHQESLQLGGSAAALELATESDRSHLDRAHLRVDAHQPAEAGRPAGLGRDDRDEHPLVV